MTYPVIWLREATPTMPEVKIEIYSDRKQRYEGGVKCPWELSRKDFPSMDDDDWYKAPPNKGEWRRG